MKEKRKKGETKCNFQLCDLFHFSFHVLGFALSFIVDNSICSVLLMSTRRRWIFVYLRGNETQCRNGVGKFLWVFTWGFPFLYENWALRRSNFKTTRNDEGGRRLSVWRKLSVWSEYETGGWINPSMNVKFFVGCSSRFDIHSDSSLTPVEFKWSKWQRNHNG